MIIYFQIINLFYSYVLFLMELLLKVITDMLNVVPESFYDKCSNIYLERTYHRTWVIVTRAIVFLNDVKPSVARKRWYAFISNYTYNVYQ